MSVDIATAAIALFSLALLCVIIIRIINSLLDACTHPLASFLTVALFTGLLVGVVFLFLVIVECQSSANPPAVCS